MALLRICLFVSLFIAALPNLSPAAGVVSLPATGQTGSNGTAWPSPRSDANQDGTVTDNLTGLVWAGNGNLMASRDASFDTEGQSGDGQVSWQRALDYVKKLNTELYLGYNDWRLPNLNEAASLYDYAKSTQAVALPISSLAAAYWTSTIFAGDPTQAWHANLDTPGITYAGKSNNHLRVLPVRGGKVIYAASADTVAPTIIAFRLPATSSKRTVTVQELTTFDDRGVTGFFLSESSTTPAAGAAGWGISITHTFAGDGNGTLHAWVKDAAGNVSLPAVATIAVASIAEPAYTPTVSLPATGVPVSANPGDDGDLKRGTAWPVPRFTAIGPWTVADHLTGLMFAQQGNLMVVRDPSFDADGQAGDGIVTWQRALDYVKKLNAERHLGFSDWRLPNVNELASLFVHDPSQVRPFTDLGQMYWTSTGYAADRTQVWFVDLLTPGVSYAVKSNQYGVLPVRGGRAISAAAADTSAPTILTFRLPETSTTRTVTLQELTTADDRGVTGFFLSESSTTPAAGAAGWGISITHTFAGDGVRTLHAWVKDAAGNVSLPVSAAIAVTGIAQPAYVPTVSLPATGVPVSATPGDDGDLKRGTAWPVPRFTAVGPWTVADHLTGLMSAQQGNLMAVRDPSFDADGQAGDGLVTWQHALDYLKKLNAEKHLGFSDWRLPNVNELASLFVHDPSQVRPFTDLGATYWTSTGFAGEGTQAWHANLQTPGISYAAKSTHYGVLPVRGGRVISAVDAAAPVIVSFRLPAASESRTVVVEELTTTDDRGVTGFRLSEDPATPSASTAGWGVAIIHTFSGDGPRTLYAWAKDAAGNVSARAEAAVAVAIGSVPAPVYAPTVKVPATGITTSALAGDDGDLKVGAAWPATRFTAVGPWMVSDALTGLFWAQQGNLMAGRAPSFDADGTAGDGFVTWLHALNYVKKLNTELYLGFSDWRLPNANELASLFAFDESITRPFTDLGTTYWSSTGYSGDGSQAWYANLQSPAISYTAKSGQYPVLPVRGGNTSLQGTDTASPAIVGFALPAAWESLTAPILDLSANDNAGVAGYRLSEDPAAPGAGDGGWRSERPLNFTFASAGAKTLHAWVKDAAGNVSASRSAATTVSPISPVVQTGNTLQQTGQTSCYDSAGALLASCDATGQDGMERIGVPPPQNRFTKAVGIMTDNLTKLVWLRDGNLVKTTNPSFDGDGAPGDGAMTWQRALDFVAALNVQKYRGFGDWRLPNINDLRSLADYSQGSNLRKAVENAGITQGLANGCYWSSTGYAAEPGNAWTFSMADGSATYFPKTDQYSCYTLAVRSGGGGPLAHADTDQTSCADTQGTLVDCAGTGQDGDVEFQTGLQPPSPRFDASRQLVSVDLMTGLVWAREGNPIKYLDPAFDADDIAGDGAVTWQHALDFVRAANRKLYLGYNDWRLPNINELASLVSREAASQSDWLTSRAFGYLPPVSVWSSTSYEGASAWHLDFATGRIAPEGKNTHRLPLLVRGGGGASAASLTVYKNGSGNGTVAGDAGAIACGGDCFQQYAALGGSATLAAAPEAGSSFTGWSGACAGTGDCTVALTGDLYVTASFSRPAAAVVSSDSGQRLCYDLADAAVPCGSASAAAGDGAFIGGPQLPFGRFHDNGDATVTDRLSGLVIPKDMNLLPSRDPSFDGDGTPDGAVSWLRALDYVEKLNRESYLGFSDWRLPNVNEMRALADYGAKSAPYTWNAMGLLFNHQENWYWSSTSYQPALDHAWAFAFNSGASTSAPKNTSYFVLPVRGGKGMAGMLRTNQTSCFDSGGAPIPCAGTGQDADTLRGEVWPAPRLTVSDDFTTITDQATGLVWPADGNVMMSEYGFLDTEGEQQGAVSWQTGMRFVARMNSDAYFGFSDWRLPSVTELATLVNHGTADNLGWLSNGSNWFLNLSAGNFWSSTTWSETPSDAWYVSLSTGQTHHQSKAAEAFILPVRGGNGFGAASLAVLKGGNGGGTVTGQQGSGISCGVACYSSYSAAGGSVTLTAVPDGGSSFLGWAGGGCSGTAPCTVPVNGALQVGAVFGQAGSTLPRIDVPQTGQGTCYNPADGATAACAGSGQDGEKRAGAAWPYPRFETALNGSTVTDKLTGLVYPREANGIAAANPSFDTDAPAGDGAVGWQRALDFVASLNASSYLGHADWRLPNINELSSLINRDKSDSAAWLMSGEAGFSDVKGNYWSSSSSAGQYAWVVDMQSGAVSGAGKGDTANHFVLPVRGGSGGRISLPATGQAGCWGDSGAAVNCSGTGQDGAQRSGIPLPEMRFGVNRDGTITDLPTGLIWTAKGNAPGPAACASAGTSMTWGEAMAYASCLNGNNYLGRKDWRIPNVNELSSIVNRGTASPSAWLLQNGFDSVSGQYWTSTASGSAYYALTVGSDDGVISNGYYYSPARVIPVAGGTLGTAASLHVFKAGSGAGSVVGGTAGISCGADCDELFPVAGGSMTLTATAEPGSTFLGWLGACSGNAPACTVALNGDINVTARFARNYTLSVAKGGTGVGTVSSLPAGIVCGGGSADCSAPFADTTSVTLSAAAADGYFFERWTGCTGAVGNTCTVTVAGASTVTAYFYNKPLTSTSLMLSSETILNNSTVDLTGKVTPFPDNGQDLSGLLVTLQVSAPDGSAVTEVLQADATGHFSRGGLGGFTQKGNYAVRATFNGTDRLTASATAVRNLLVGSSAGYAVLVQGRIPGDEGILSHNKTTNRIYLALRGRGFLDENIQYFNYNANQAAAGIQVDALPTKGAIQSAVESWAKDRMNGSPAPLYVIMVNHGNVNTFHLGNDSIAPVELDAWLNNLENGLNPAAKAEKRIVIDGSCYSGSFIPKLSRANRIVIASAASDEESYKGTVEGDGVRSGEFFLDAMFEQLKRGLTLNESFQNAAQLTRTFTRKGGASTNSGGYGDFSVQHPLLDDDGNGVGSNALSVSDGDGVESQAVYLGVGQSATNAAAGPADVAQIPPTQFLGAAGGAEMWLKATDAARVESGWVEVRSPSTTLAPGSSALQVDINLPKVLFTPDGAGKFVPVTPYAGFVESGMYELYYYTQDAQTHEKTPVVRGVVYKAKTGNTAPPAVVLGSPAQGAADVKTTAIFQWSAAVDAQGDPVTYTLEIATDAAFASVVHREEELQVTTAFVLDGVLKDSAGYYWRVKAVDQYGAVSTSAVAGFSTDNTNGLPGILKGYVRDGASGRPLSGVAMTVGTRTLSTLANGAYLTAGSAGSITVRAAKSGYKEKTAVLTMTAGKVTSGDFRLEAVTLSGKPGDCDNGGTVTIAELQAAVGMFLGTEAVRACVDLDGSGRVAVSELQKVVNALLGL